MVTEFGKLLKVTRIQKGNLSQEELSLKLGYSHAHISNMANGKIDPDVKFLIRCQNFFNLNKEETIAFFYTAFSSCKENINIELDYLDKERRERLIKVVTALLLMPDFVGGNETQDNINRSFDFSYEALKAFGEIKHLEYKDVKKKKAK
jgi:transcriptional regulator with XRE-family HTH domain